MILKWRTKMLIFGKGCSNPLKQYRIYYVHSIMDALFYEHIYCHAKLEIYTFCCSHYRDCAVPYTRGIFIRIRHTSLWFSEVYALMLHWITIEYAVSSMKMLHVRDCAISVLWIKKRLKPLGFNHFDEFDKFVKVRGEVHTCNMYLYYYHNYTLSKIDFNYNYLHLLILVETNSLIIYNACI